ncbi:hypothetical protein ACFYM2_18660 [Streptomyces sp. NPDC006711]|uniref:hypothetical protein n=1 Tax=Streptomyces sp. NPDC006711 TaxID=3364762 RepID=UPI003690BE82
MLQDAERAVVRRVAVAHIRRAEQWRAFAPTPYRLVLALHAAGLPGATACRAAADYTGDFSVYPAADTAVRDAVTRLLSAPQLPSPEDALTERWDDWTRGRSARHALTLFTLTAGAEPPLQEAAQSSRP